MKPKKRNLEEKDFEQVLDNDNNGKNFLTLHNDDIHTFDYVIDTLMDVCEHDLVQAEQCTFIVHFKGKCEVKKGEVDLLMPMKKELVKRGLTATIDK